jgi:Tol biopolymer transport system component
MARWFSGAIEWQPEVPLGVSGTDPFLSSDELTLHFSVNFLDIYTARRNAIGEVFTGAAIAMDLSTAAGESRVSFTGDGKVVVIASDRTLPSTQGQTDVFYGTRADSGSAFIWDQTRVVLVNNTGNQFDPMLSTDGLRLYFAPSDVGMPQRVHVAQRAAITDPFGPPVMIAELVGGDYENDPALSADERVIVFNRFVTGELFQHIWYAVRSSATATFGMPALVPGVNTIDQNDQDPVLSPDGCRIYYTRQTQLFVREMAPR